MIPPEEYNMDVDRADIFITVGIDRTLDGDELEDTFYQIDIAGEEEFTGLSPGELMHVLSSLNAVQGSILNGWLHHMLSDDGRDKDFKVDEELE